MPSVVQKIRRRGSPRKVYPRLTHRVPEWVGRTGRSRSKTFEQMAAGKLRYRQDAPGAPREIFTSEYVRLGFVGSLDELS